jgi:hypothetical protein
MWNAFRVALLLERDAGATSEAAAVLGHCGRLRLARVAAGGVAIVHHAHRHDEEQIEQAATFKPYSRMAPGL